MKKLKRKKGIVILLKQQQKYQRYHKYLSGEELLS